MASELIPIAFHKVLQSRSYTIIILGTSEKQFAIYTEPQVGRDLQIYLTQGKKPRPSSHNLIQSILTGYNIHPIQIVIEDVQDALYFARLFLEMVHENKKTILEVDARPSDCITLALLSNTPMYCRKEVLEQASTVQ
jgi:uncharacterized protein